MGKLSVWDWVSIVLVIIGAIDLGLVGLFGLDVIGAVFGTMSIITRLIYILIGIGGIYNIAIVSNLQKKSA